MKKFLLAIAALFCPGLVIGNDPSRPPERYSDYVMPNWLVEGFVDTVDDRPGGTLAPTLRLEVDGARTRVAEQLDYGLVPAMAAREPTHARP